MFAVMLFSKMFLDEIFVHCPLTTQIIDHFKLVEIIDSHVILCSGTAGIL